MTNDDEAPDLPTEETPTFLSSLPDQPITDDIVRRVGESEHPKIRGAMGLPGADPRTIEAFQLDLKTKTYVLVFDPTERHWRTFASFDTEGMRHEEIVDRAAEIYNEWLTTSLSDRIAASDDTDSDT